MLRAAQAEAAARVPAEPEGLWSQWSPAESCYLSRPKAEELLLIPQESARLSSVLVLVPEWLWKGLAPVLSSWGLARESSYWE